MLFRDIRVDLTLGIPSIYVRRTRTGEISRACANIGGAEELSGIKKLPALCVLNRVCRYKKSFNFVDVETKERELNGDEC